MIEKARRHSEGYEISARREEAAVDFYRFFYGETDVDAEEASEEQGEELTSAEHGAFLKGACLLFAGALGTVLTLLLF